MTENTSTKEDQVKEDVIPEADDDVEIEVTSDKTPKSETEDEPDSINLESIDTRNKHDVARDDIAALYRARRDAEILEDKEGDKEEIPEEEPIEEKESASESDTETEKKEETTDDDPIVSLKIDGIERKMSQSAANSLAQKYLASDNRLSEANRLLDEMKALKESEAVDKSATDISTDADEPTEPGTQTTGLDPEKLSEIAEQLQVGDQDDAVKAISSLLALAKVDAPDKSAPQLSTEERKAEYREFLVQENIENEFQESLDNFGKEYPAIADDQELHQVSISTAARIMREEMAEKNLLSEAELHQLALDPRETADVFRRFKNAGTSLRSYSEVFTDVGNHVTSKFLPEKETPSPTLSASEKDSEISQKRTEKKRTAQQQPRQAAVRSQPDKGPKPKTSAEVVEEMRAARNYPPSV